MTFIACVCGIQSQRVLPALAYRFSADKRAVVTTDAGRRQCTVIDFGAGPNRRTGMTGFARLRGRKMNRRFAGGVCKDPMALRTRAGGLRMIDLGDRFPHGIDMARFTQIGRGGMSAGLAIFGQFAAAVMTGDACRGRLNKRMIESDQRPCRRFWFMATLAGVGGR